MLCPVRVSHAVDCVRLGVPGSACAAPSDRVPTRRQSRDGVCPSPWDDLQCAIERRNSSEIVLRFIKLSYVNTWCAWAALDRLPSALECAVKSSLVEGFVPQKLIVYPMSSTSSSTRLTIDSQRARNRRYCATSRAYPLHRSPHDAGGQGRSGGASSKLAGPHTHVGHAPAMRTLPPPRTLPQEARPDVATVGQLRP